MLPPKKGPSPKQLKNQAALTVYAGVLVTLVLAVAAARWTRILCNRRARPSSSPVSMSLSRHALRSFRALEKHVTSAWLGRLPRGLLVLLAVLLVVNSVLSVTIIAGLRVNTLASRFGWLAVANMALCAFFGMRNTPTSRLAAVSHAQINTAHRIVGYVVLVLVALHAVFYTVHFGRQGRWESLLEPGNVQGFPAGVGMLVLALGYWRHWHYEAFYASHVGGFVATVVFTALHRPDWAKKLPLVMSIVAAAWVCERVARLARTVYVLSACRSSAVVEPLAGGVRVVLHNRRAQYYSPGTHCFLWVPRAGLAQSHPFTVVDSGAWGLEVVAKARDGFTRRLAELAAREPGGSVCASVDGPYGTLPDCTAHERLVLVAGGSGAAYTFGLANHLRGALGHAHPHTTTVDFVWAVRDAAQLAWFARSLARLQRPVDGMTVRVTVYVTGKTEAWTETETTEPGEYDALLTNAYGPPVAPSVAAGTFIRRHCAMDTDDVLYSALASAGADDRALVVGCGPKTLLAAVRASVDAFRGRHPARIVNVYCEDF